MVLELMSAGHTEDVYAILKVQACYGMSSLSFYLWARGVWWSGARCGRAYRRLAVPAAAAGASARRRSRRALDPPQVQEELSRTGAGPAAAAAAARVPTAEEARHEDRIAHLRSRAGELFGLMDSNGDGAVDRCGRGARGAALGGRTLVAAAQAGCLPLRALPPAVRLARPPAARPTRWRQALLTLTRPPVPTLHLQGRIHHRHEHAARRAGLGRGKPHGAPTHLRTVCGMGGCACARAARFALLASASHAHPPHSAMGATRVRPSWGQSSAPSTATATSPPSSLQTFSSLRSCGTPRPTRRCCATSAATAARAARTARPRGRTDLRGAKPSRAGEACARAPCASAAARSGWALAALCRRGTASPRRQATHGSKMCPVEFACGRLPRSGRHSCHQKVAWSGLSHCPVKS